MERWGYSQWLVPIQTKRSQLTRLHRDVSCASNWPRTDNAGLQQSTYCFAQVVGFFFFFFFACYLEYLVGCFSNWFECNSSCQTGFCFAFVILERKRECARVRATHRRSRGWRDNLRKAPTGQRTRRAAPRRSRERRWPARLGADRWWWWKQRCCCPYCRWWYRWQAKAQRHWCWAGSENRWWMVTERATGRPDQCPAGRWCSRCCGSRRPACRCGRSGPVGRRGRSRYRRPPS
mmetsp:Transcript_1415/g.4406  ORF Transcript_1415/g.4406 Transcript_1415/m.4406 type:complete len:234 (-) Transcript_1415:289-990(-)